MPQPPEPSEPNPQVERSGTLIETDDDIRQAFLSGQQGTPARPTGSCRTPCASSGAANRAQRESPSRSARRHGRQSPC